VVALIDDGFDALVRRARESDERAFAMLVEPLVPKLRGYLRGIGGDEVDDLLDEVLFSVYRRLDRFVGDEKGFRSWVFSIAHNVAIDHYRRQRRRPEPVDTSDPRYLAVAGALRGVDEVIADRVLEQRLLDVLARLPAAQRQVLLLRTVADLSVDETAAAVGRTPGAVRVLQHRALASVRRLIAPIA
jgi:RNA polymerase sigma-70 factor (ECF subfamily)